MKANLLVKLLGGFGFVTLILAGLGVYSLVQMDDIHQDVEYVNTKTLPSTQAISEITLDLNRFRRYQLQYINTPQQEARVQLDQQMSEMAETIDAGLSSYGSLISDEQDEALFNDVKAMWLDYQPLAQKALDYVRQGKPDLANEAMSGEAYASFSSLSDATDAWRLYNAQLSSGRLEDIIAVQENARGWMLFLIIFGALVAFSLGFFLARQTSRAARQMAAIAEGISRGELTHTITVNSTDEMGEMAASFTRMIDYLQGMARVADEISDGNLTVHVDPVSSADVLGVSLATMVQNLTRIIGRVNEGIATVSIASMQLNDASTQAGQATGQIALTMQQIARGTALQSEGVTRTAGSVEQLNHAIEGIARGAQEQTRAVEQVVNLLSRLDGQIKAMSDAARDSAEGGQQASQAARNGVDTVNTTLNSMQSIRNKVGQSAERVREMGDRSSQIGVIVETIDDIANQTNLLALNAAIEAARAGEQGKGFAVVADEVRKLAERSSVATREIAGLIREIQITVEAAVVAMDEGIQEVESGVERAGSAGEALHEILATAEKVAAGGTAAELVAVEAMRASNDVVAAMDSVSAVVEENTAATEEMSASATEVTKSIENIASVSEENSASVEEVSASAEEVSAQATEVNNSAVSLAEMSEDLMRVMSFFKTEEGQHQYAPTGGNGRGDDFRSADSGFETVRLHNN